MIPRLGVNIDHVATLRQARGTDYPDVLQAARVCIENGADQITMHLREDRRHVQDNDVFQVREVLRGTEIPLNLEMGASRDVLDVAAAAAPEWICLVPEKREERTTEGGLDLSGFEGEKIASLCDELKDKIFGLKISLFVEAKEEILTRALSMNIDAVEIHTGQYAEDFLQEKALDLYKDQFAAGKEMVVARGIGYHAGHGLTAGSLAPLLAWHLFSEYNVGHWIVAQGVFDGLGNVVRGVKEQFVASSS